VILMPFPRLQMNNQETFSYSILCSRLIGCRRKKRVIVTGLSWSDATKLRDILKNREENRRIRIRGWASSFVDFIYIIQLENPSSKELTRLRTLKHHKK